MMGTLSAVATRWNDYRGTAAADDAYVVVGEQSLYDLAGLDRDRWTIVAIDLVFASADAVTVYAVDSHPSAEGPAPSPVEPESLAVTAFTITDPAAVDSFRKRAFDRVAVRLISQPYHTTPLVLPDPVNSQRSVLSSSGLDAQTPSQHALR